MSTTQLSLTVAVLAVSLGASDAHAHDAVGLINHEMQSTVPALDAARAAAPTADVATRSVLANLLLWPVPRRLTVCFLQGSPAARHAVADSMRRTWPLAQLTQGRLDFDTGEMDGVPDCSRSTPADLRIDFKDRAGYWSYVGVESLANFPSMNFQGFNAQLPAQAEIDRVVGHETGHALGRAVWCAAHST